ncbi:hypothetical protein DH2020_000504 [Rehmannia glutinosa]|uniref:Uncharacterized protein n=1 Tax=Rehmannia glutinosa TaxID=99300 RepID=A0ABR0XXC8_REHGL
MANRKVTIVKVATSKSSNATSESIGVITRSMSKKLNASCDMNPLHEIVEKDSPLLKNTNVDNQDMKDEFFNSSLAASKCNAETFKLSTASSLSGEILSMAVISSSISKTLA